MRRYALRCLTSLLIALAAAGCVGVTTSQVKWTLATAEDRTGLDSAMAYANQAKAQYREALGNQSALTRWLGLGLIPLSAAAGGLGITGGNTAAFTALLMTTGAGLAEMAWLTSKPEQRAWVAGFNAITCAQTAVEPVRYLLRSPSPLDQAEVEVRTKLADLDPALAAARLALQAATGIADSDSLNAAARWFADAQATRDSANEALATSERARQEAARIPAQLIDAVDAIGGQVALTLVEQGPDVQALTRLVSGLAQGYGQFVQVPAKGTTPSGPSGTPKSQGDIKDPRLTALTDVFRTLEERRLALDRATRALANVVNTVATTKPTEQLQACGVNPEKIAAPFTVQPSGPIHITAGTPATVGFVIRGGAPPFAVNLEGAQLEGLSVQHRDPMGASFTAQATDKVKPGVAAIDVGDRSGVHQFIEIDVTAAAAPKAGVDGGGAQNDLVSALQSAQTKLSQSPPAPLTLGSNTAKVIPASVTVDSKNNKLNVGVEIDDASGKPVSNAVATNVISKNKSALVQWLSLDAQVKSSINVQPTNQGQ